MTISSETRKAGPYVGNGVTIEFPFLFKVFADTDVSVTIATLSTGAEAVLTSGYTVTLNADQNASPGGYVTYNPSGVPIDAGTTLTIGSVVSNTQETHIVNGGAFLPANIENMVDRAMIAVQQLAEKVARSIKFAFSDSSSPGDLPTAAQRANKFLAFDAGGQLIVTAAPGGGVPNETIVTVIDTITLLKGVAAPATAMTYLVRGFAARGDGGGGLYFWNSGDVTADNGGSIIELNVGGVGRFNKLF